MCGVCETSPLLILIHLWSAVCGEIFWVFPFNWGRWYPNDFGVMKCGSHMDAQWEAPLTYSFCTKATVTWGWLTKTNSCSHWTPRSNLLLHIFQFTHRWTSAVLSYWNCHVPWWYFSSCRWLRVVSSRLISWMAGSWSCWFRYWVVYLMTSYSCK